MAENPIVRKLVVLVLALTLMAGAAPVAGTAMTGCDMGAMPASLSQDQRGMPMQKQQTPSKDVDGCCTAMCAAAIGLSQVEYSPELAGTPADPVWPVQGEWTRTRSRPELPPPIAFL